MVGGHYGEHHLHGYLGLYLIAIHKRSNRGRRRVTAFGAA